jgi:NADH:ubiquinone reductase (H+-translocating)
LTPAPSPGDRQTRPPRILIIGGGYTGFYAARELEKLLRVGEAAVALVDPLPYMTYQPFLPEVIAGAIEARHSVISFRRHLRRTRIVAAEVVGINHAQKTVTTARRSGTTSQLSYDIVVVTAGAVSRIFPIPGIADHAFGLKHIEEAVTIRDRLLANFDEAVCLSPGPQRQKLLTVTFIGGGYAGVEGIGELRGLATELLRFYPEITTDELRFHLVEVQDRVLPGISRQTSNWVIDHLRSRGVRVHLQTKVESAEDATIRLSSGETYESALIVWTAGMTANPTVARHTDLPVDAHGRIRVCPDLRVGTPEMVIADAWAGGDNAAVPDLTGAGIEGFTAPTAQHAVRQGKLLARNITAVLRGKSPKQYFHRNLGTVATLGVGSGVFQSGPIAVTGFPAWLIHRGYHGLAVPSWERKWRVAWDWLHSAWLGRDIVGLNGVEEPRANFTSHAPRPGTTADAAVRVGPRLRAAEGPP